jgi:hypothetical protein
VNQIHRPSSELIGGFSTAFRKQRIFSQFLFTDEISGTLGNVENSRNHSIFAEANTIISVQKKPPPAKKTGCGPTSLTRSATFG